MGHRTILASPERLWTFGGDCIAGANIVENSAGANLVSCQYKCEATCASPRKDSLILDDRTAPKRSYYHDANEILAAAIIMNDVVSPTVGATVPNYGILATYVEVTAGTCAEAGYIMIADQDECNTAAVMLGLSDTSSYTNTHGRFGHGAGGLLLCSAARGVRRRRRQLQPFARCHPRPVHRAVLGRQDLLVPRRRLGPPRRGRTGHSARTSPRSCVEHMDRIRAGTDDRHGGVDDQVRDGRAR